MATSLGSATVKLNTGTTLSLISTGALTISNNIIIAGPSTINGGTLSGNTNNYGRGTSGSVTLANTTLNLNNAIRTGATTPANTGDDVILNGTLILQGLESSTYNSQVVGNIDSQFNGKITGPGALTTYGNGGLSISNATNDYAGGTNFFAGWRGPSNVTASLGTGPVLVGSGHVIYLRAPANIASASSVAWASTLGLINNVNYYQTPTGVASVGMNGVSAIYATDNIAIGTGYNAIKTGPYGTAFALMSGTWSNAIDMALLGSHATGNAPWWLGSQGTQSYTATSLGADGGVYRLGAGGSGSNLTFTTAALAGSASVIIGNPYFRVAGGGNIQGNIFYGAQEVYTGSTTINKGSSLNLNVTTLSNLIPAASSLYISGALTLSGAFSVAGPMLGQTAVTVFNTGYGIGTGQTVGLQFNNNAVTTASTDIRIVNTAGLNLTSANFRFLGSNSAVATNQTVGSINFEGQDLLEVSRGNATANNANFTVTNLNRLNNGVITIATTGGAFSAAGGTDTKFTATNIQTAGTGTTAALSVTNGMVAPWILDTSTATNPSFVTAGATGLGPVTYDLTASAAGTLQTATALQKVDVTTASPVLTANATMQAVLFVPSSAMAQIRPGRHVKLRYDAFPFEKFGQFTGTITKVSEADVPVADLEAPPAAAKDRALFRVRVTLDRDQIEAYGSTIRLRPGLTLSADIELDRRRLIDWMFDPLYALGQKL